MIPRIVRSLSAAALAAALAVLAWPQALGLQNTEFFAHAVSFRGVFALGAGVLVLIFIAGLIVSRARRFFAMALVVTALFGAVNVGILSSRGVDTVASASAAEPEAGSVTVLAWNTLGGAPGADAIADLALAEQADVVTLPETTEATGIAVAEAMRIGGRPMWVHTLAFDLVSDARSTTVLISPDLGSYEVSNSATAGPPGNTSVLPSVVATPASGTGPTIVAVHAVAPIRYEMDGWRADLDWLAKQCTFTDDTPGNMIMAGDFNATVDHMAGRTSAGAFSAVLGDCADAATAAGSGAVGTWPTAVPALLGSPIDHVLATPNWRVDGLRVLESLDGAGSDHRPVVATLTDATP